MNERTYFWYNETKNEIIEAPVGPDVLSGLMVADQEGFAQLCKEWGARSVEVSITSKEKSAIFTSVSGDIITYIGEI